MQQELTLGIDLGGTNIKSILLAPDGHILEKNSTPTNDDHGDQPWKQGVKDVVAAYQARTGNAITRVGISAPGLADPENICIAYLPNKLVGIENFIWRDFLGIDTLVLNDAHAALVAEARLGAGKGYRDIVLLTLGTGVGGGVLVNGNLLQGKHGRAGHFGHISVSGNREQSITGTPGSLENAIGETTVRRRTYGRFSSTKELVDAYRAHDTFATYVWLRSVQQLSRGIVSLINAFSPELVILGGGIAKAGEALFNPLQDFLDVYEWRPGNFQTQVLPAAMGEYTGAVGAALFSSESVPSRLA